MSEEERAVIDAMIEECLAWIERIYEDWEEGFLTKTEALVRDKEILETIKTLRATPDYNPRNRGRQTLY